MLSETKNLSVGTETLRQSKCQTLRLSASVREQRYTAAKAVAWKAELARHRHTSTVFHRPKIAAKQALRARTRRTACAFVPCKRELATETANATPEGIKHAYQSHSPAAAVRARPLRRVQRLQTQRTNHGREPEPPAQPDRKALEGSRVAAEEVHTRPRRRNLQTKKGAKKAEAARPIEGPPADDVRLRRRPGSRRGVG